MQEITTVRHVSVLTLYKKCDTEAEKAVIVRGSWIGKCSGSYEGCLVGYFT